MRILGTSMPCDEKNVHCRLHIVTCKLHVHCKLHIVQPLTCTVSLATASLMGSVSPPSSPSRGQPVQSEGDG